MPTESQIQNAFTAGIDNLDSMFAPGWTESAKDAFGGEEDYQSNAKKLAISLHMSDSEGYDPRDVGENYESYARVFGLSGDVNKDYMSLQKHYGFVQEQKKEVGQFEGFVNSFKGSWFNLKKANNSMIALANNDDSAAKQEQEIAEIEETIRELQGTPMAGEIGRLQSILTDKRENLKQMPRRRHEAIQEVVSSHAEMAKLGVSKAFEEFLEAEGVGASLGKLAGDPIEIISNILASSSIQMAPAIAGTIVAGPAGGAAGAFQTEYSHTFVEAMQKDDVDLNNPESINAFINDKERRDKASDAAIKKASVISLFQFVGGQLAGRISPAFRNRTVGAALEASVQIGEEVGGEALGQLFAFGDIDTKEVLMELIASGPNTAVEFARNTLTSDSKIETSQAFDALTMDENGQPLTAEAMQKMIPKIDLNEFDMEPMERMSLEMAGKGDVDAAQSIQSLQLQRLKEQEDIRLTPEPTEVDTAVDEIKLLTKGIESAETEIETNLNVKDEGAVDVRPGDDRDGDPADIEQKKRAEEEEAKARKAEEKAIAKEEARLDKEQREQEKIFQEELKELNDLQEIADNPPPTRAEAGEEKLTVSEEKTVQALLDHATGKKKLSAKRRAVLEGKVRGDIRTRRALDRAAAKLKKQKESARVKLEEQRAKAKKKLAEQKAAFETKLDRKLFAKDEKIANLREKLDQQKNDLALKAKLAADKIRKKTDARIKKIKEDLKAKRLTQTQALEDQAGAVREAIGQIESMVNQMPAEVQARFKGFKKLANAKTLPTLEKGLNESLNKLQNLYIEETQKVLVKNINKTVKQTTKDLKAAKAGKKPFRHGPEVIRYMELAGYNGGEARKVAQQRFEDLMDRIESAPDDKPYEMTEGDYEIQREGMIPNVAEGQTVDNELLARYLADLKSVKADGLSAHNAKKARRAEKIKRTGNVIKTSIEANSQRKKSKDLPQSDAAKDRGIMDMIREGNQELLDTRSISTALTGEKRNRLDTLIFEKVADGVSDSILAHQEYIAFIEQKAKDLGLDLAKSGNIPIKEVGKKQMSMYEAMFVYGHSQNDLGMEHLKHTDFGGIKLRGEIQGIVDLLPQNHKDFVDSLIDYNDNVMYPRLNELYMEMYGVPMPKEDRYLPLMNLSSKTAFDHALKENPTFMRIHTSFLKARSKSKLGFETLELIGSLQKHNASAEHAIALHSTLTDANLMFRDEGLQKAMNDAFPGSLAYVTEYINTVAKGEMIKPKGQWDRWLRIMRNNTRTYWLAANPGAWAKTQAPMISALQSIDKGAAASAAMRHFGKSNWRLASSKSKFMKTRPHSNRIEMMELASRDFEPGAIKTFKNLKSRSKILHSHSQKYAYWAYNPLDLAATSTAWVGKYTESMNKHGVEAEAILEADDVVKRFFPGGRIDELPPLFREQGMKKELFIFTSDMNRHYNLGYTAAQLKQRRVQEAIMFAFYGVLMSSAYLAFTDAGMDAFKETLGLKDEEDERGKQFLKDSARYMASQVVGGIPVLGKVVESSVAAASGDGQLSRMMSKQTPISMYPAGQAMTQNFGTAAFSLFGIPGGNLLAPHIDDYLKDRDGEDDFLSDF